MGNIPLHVLLPGLADLVRQGPRDIAPAHAGQAHEQVVRDLQAAVQEAKNLAQNAHAEAQRLQALRMAERNEIALMQAMRAPVTSAELINEARLKYGIDFKQWNAVFCGDAGTGKSSAIRAILKLPPNLAPAVGVVETTSEMRRYVSPEMASFALWDAPGCGTDANPIFHSTDPEMHYYRRFSIYAFDLVVVFYADRLTEAAAYLVKTCLQANMPIIVVRNKADRMVEDIADAVGSKVSEADLIKKAHEYFEGEMRRIFGELVVRIPHYLVSMRAYQNNQARFSEISFIESMVSMAKMRAA